jgi:hypothetical protein
MKRNVNAIPTVKQVSIMGEPLVGGTLGGSYIYENADENPEGSRYFAGIAVVSVEALSQLPLI